MRIEELRTLRREIFEYLYNIYVTERSGFFFNKRPWIGRGENLCAGKHKKESFVADNIKVSLHTVYVRRVRKSCLEASFVFEDRISNLEVYFVTKTDECSQTVENDVRKFRERFPDLEEVID